MQPQILKRKSNTGARRAAYFTTGLFFSLSGVFTGASIAFAASGNIDAAHTYAFSNIGGYVNFNPTNGGVTVTDSLLSGYAWSANDGWINFAPTNGGVRNDGNGTLSGFAWDETAGYVNFSGVTIDSSGKFHGQATGGTVNGVSYALNFDCTSCSVVTSWRVVSSSASSSNPPSGGSRAALPSSAVSTLQNAPPTVSLPLAVPAAMPNTVNGTKASGAVTAVSGIGASNKGPVSSPSSRTFTATPSKDTAVKSVIHTTTAVAILKSAVSSVVNFMQSVAQSASTNILTFLRFFWKF